MPSGMNVQQLPMRALSPNVSPNVPVLHLTNDRHDDKLCRIESFHPKYGPRKKGNRIEILKYTGLPILKTKIKFY